MHISRIETGELRANTYFVCDAKTRRGILIDSGDDVKRILKAIETFAILYIFLTHTHFDHLLGLPRVVEKTGAQVVVSEKEKDVVAHGKVHLPTASRKHLADAETFQKIPGVIHVTGGEHFQVDGLSIDIIATPGHTVGSLSIHVNDALFTGDTLFSHSIGRTDLPTGSHRDIMKSLQKLFKLPGDTRVFPGHGEETTIAKRKGDYESGLLY